MRRLVLFLLAATVFGLLAQTAAADRIPTPISSADLQRFAQRLKLSREQHLALAAQHQHYLSAFRESLGSSAGPLERYLALRREIGDIPFSHPPKQALAEFITLHGRIDREFAALDEQLLRSVEQSLNDEQLEHLDAIIAWRRCAVLVRSQFIADWLLEWCLDDVIDLWLLAADLELAGDSFELIEQTLHRHDLQQALLLAHLDAAAASVWRQWLDVVHDEVADDLDAGERFSLMGNAWKAAAIEAVPAARRVRTLSVETARQIIQLLPEDDAELFRAAFHERAYPQASMHGRQLRQAALAAQQMELADEPAADLAVLISRIVAHDGMYLDRAAGIIDRSINNAIARVHDTETYELMEDSLQQLLEQRRESDEQFMQQLATLVGPERAALLPRGQRSAGDSTSLLSQRHRDSLDPDPFIPGPIDRRHLHRFAQALGLSAAQRQLLEVLHDDYHRAFLDLRSGPIEQIVTIFTGFSALDDGSGMSGYTPAENDHQKYRLRLEVLDRITAVDNQLLSDVQHAVLGPQQANEIWRLRLARALQFIRPDWPRESGVAAFTEHRADIAAAVAQLDLSVDDRRTADAIVRAHADVLIEALGALHRASLESEYRRGLSMARDRDPSEEEHLHERARAAARAHVNARMAVVARFRQVRDELIAAMPEHEPAILAAYERAAYPNVFEDENSLHRTLNAAMEQDLDSDQRARLHEIVLAYRTAYHQLSSEMALIISQSPFAGQFRWLPREAFEDKKHREERIALLKSQRDELAGTAFVQLRQLLTPVQLAAIGIEH